MSTPRRHSGRSRPPGDGVQAMVGFGLFAILLGIALIYMAAQYDPDAPVVCGGKVMKPGDTCIVVRGPGRDRSYEEMKADNHVRPNYVIGPALLVAGMLLVAAPGVRDSRGRGAAR